MSVPRSLRPATRRPQAFLAAASAAERSVGHPAVPT